MRIGFALGCTVCALATLNASAATLYVSLESTNPIPPYATWATAATNIQDAVDVSKDGDMALVTNGLYTLGERDGNRVVITNALRLESVNGALATTIDGKRSVRCVFLGPNAVLGGFTLTNGFASEGGGAFGGTLHDCTVTGSWALQDGGGVHGCTLHNCTLSGNRAWTLSHTPNFGGGASASTLYDCTLTGNSAATSGGGTHSCTLYSCRLTGNSAPYGGGAITSVLSNCIVQLNTAPRGLGGGAYNCTLYDCVLVANTAISGNGGGASSSILEGCLLKDNTAQGGPSQGSGGGGGGAVEACTLENCTLMGNSAALGGGAITSTLYSCRLIANQAIYHGGGSWGGILYNCTVTGNAAAQYGGGIYGSTAYGCTVVENSALLGGGGVSEATLYNCIVYYNNAPDALDCANSALSYSCTTTLPTNGVGNITGPPLFMDLPAGDFRLREGSPCVDAGGDLRHLNVSYNCGPTDIVGNTRFIDGDGDGRAAWDIGAYEFNSFKPPRFSGYARLTTNGWVLEVAGPPNKWARIQRSSNLKDWEEIWSGFMGAEGVCHINDADIEPKVMFYRAVVP